MRLAFVDLEIYKNECAVKLIYRLFNGRFVKWEFDSERRAFSNFAVFEYQFALVIIFDNAFGE
jgi:hypothetical protein